MVNVDRTVASRSSNSSGYVPLSIFVPRRPLTGCAPLSTGLRRSLDMSFAMLPTPMQPAMASAVQFPFLKFPFLKPGGAPGLSPPCSLHRLRPRKAGRWHAVPARVIAPHRGAVLRFLSRVSTAWSMGLSATFCCPPSIAGFRCGLTLQSISKISLTY